MAKPWEQYQQNAAPAKPWERYAEPEQPAAPENIDYLEGYGPVQRGLIGAGKATNDLLQSFGLGIEGNPEADAAISSDTAGMVGGVLAQAGMMYAGGTALKGAGAGLQALRSAPVAGRAAGAVGKGLQWLGTGATNPSGYKQAATAGALFGAASQPGDVGSRLANATAGGVGGAAGMAVGRGIGHAADYLKSLVPRPAVDREITGKLLLQGVDLHALPRAMQQQVIKAGRRSLDAVDNLNPEELRRAADFEALGIKPTRGWITRDANDWWMENNLNTVNPEISTRFRDANQTLLQSVRKSAPDASDYEVGKRLGGAVSSYDAALKTKADSLYQAARGMAGRDIPLDAARFVNNASVDLDQQMLGSKLPGDTLSWFKKITSGQEPFDMGTAMQRLQAINGRIYSTSDPAEAKALGMVKSHLINALDSYPGGAPGVIGGQQSEQAALSSAFKGARGAAADRFRFQESSPLVDRVLSGKFTAEQLPDMVGRMGVDELAGLQAIQAERGVPVMEPLRDAARAYIRDAATLQSETGGSFTVHGLRKALDKIGPEKGRLLFGSDGWNGYQQVLRAAGNIGNAPIKPAGSSTAPNLLRLMQKVPIPGAGPGLELLMSGVSKAKNAMDVNAALNSGLNIPRGAPSSSYLPLLTAPGLLTLTNQAR